MQRFATWRSQPAVPGGPPFRPSRVWAALFLPLAAFTTLAVLSVGFGRPAPSAPLVLDRLSPLFAASSNPTIENAGQRLQWTQYGSYGTVRIGRVERPARLLTGTVRSTRQITVPLGGGRYEAVVGAIEAPVTVRVGRVGCPPRETRVMADTWTRVIVDLDAFDGPSQSLAVEMDVSPGGIGAWGSEVVTPARRHPNPPDVVLVSLDTVRRDQLTPYVPSLATTPVLAALAREATLFEQAISTSSWTIASHATLFTGRFPPDSLGYKSTVESAEYTLPEMFAARGYRTFGVSGGPYTDPRWGFHQGFDAYVASGERENAKDATSRAIEWIETAGHEPVFLFLNYFNAHEPLTLSEEVKKATGITEDVPHGMWYDLYDGRLPVTSAVRARLLRAYQAEVTTIDRELGRLFEHLRRSDRWSRALVIVWGDHGQLLGERGDVGHALTLEEELLRVPLIIKPGAGSGLTAGSYRFPVQNDDLFPLLQALGGLPNRKGSELLAAINANLPVRRFAFSKIHHDPLPVLVGHRRWRSATQWAVGDGSTKIVRDLEGRYVAFDVTGQEERPIAAPGQGAPLVAALERFRVWSGRAQSASTLIPLSPAEIERLRSLGYIQ